MCLKSFGIACIYWNCFNFIEFVLFLHLLNLLNIVSNLLNLFDIDYTCLKFIEIIWHLKCKLIRRFTCVVWCWYSSIVWALHGALWTFSVLFLLTCLSMWHRNIVIPIKKTATLQRRKWFPNHVMHMSCIFCHFVSMHTSCCQKQHNMTFAVWL